MGTNYYLNRIPMEDEIHVGKSSYGWKFAFQIDDTDCLDMGGLDYTRENAYKVIQGYLGKGYMLFDEYGAEVTLEEFIDLVESKIEEEEHYLNGEDTSDEFVTDGARWVTRWFC